MARRFAGGSHFWSPSSCRERRTLLSPDEIVPASLGELLPIQARGHPFDSRADRARAKTRR